MISTQSIISLLILITIFIIVVALVLAISKLGLSWILGTCGYKLKKEFSSEKKRVVITGGSSGIGLELARAYLEQNAIVIIIARDVKKLTQAHEDLIESVSKSLNKNKGDVKLDYISCDVSSSDDSVRNALGPWIEKYGGVDVLVNCAGTSIAGVFEELPEQEFERMHRINVMGSVHSTRVIVPLMKKQKSGQIIFVASQVAQVMKTLFSMFPFFANYLPKYSTRRLFMDIPHMLPRSGHCVDWPRRCRWKSSPSTSPWP